MDRSKRVRASSSASGAALRERFGNGSRGAESGSSFARLQHEFKDSSIWKAPYPDTHNSATTTSCLEYLGTGDDFWQSLYWARSQGIDGAPP